MDRATVVSRSVEVSVIADVGNLKQELLKRAGWPNVLERAAENLPMLLLRRAPMAGGTNLQLANNIALYVTNQELRHSQMIAMLSLLKAGVRSSSA